MLGPRAKGYYVVKAGLHKGERVVVNGNFKIDSAVQILAKPSMMEPDRGPPTIDPGDHDRGSRGGLVIRRGNASHADGPKHDMPPPAPDTPQPGRRSDQAADAGDDQSKPLIHLPSQRKPE